MHNAVNQILKISYFIVLSLQAAQGYVPNDFKYGLSNKFSKSRALIHLNTITAFLLRGRPLQIFHPYNIYQQRPFDKTNFPYIIAHEETR